MVKWQGEGHLKVILGLDITEVLISISIFLTSHNDALFIYANLMYSGVLCSLKNKAHIDGLVQNFSNSIANALELLQSCTKPTILYQSILFIRVSFFSIIFTRGTP